MRRNDSTLCRDATLLLLACLTVGMLGGCYSMRSSGGGGQTLWRLPRIINAADIALPDGYMIEPVATGLTFPTGVTFDAAGDVYVVESGYSYGEVWTEPRLLRVAADGTTSTVARGDSNGPWTAVAFHAGAFYVTEGGTLQGGRILRIQPDGTTTALLSGLPSFGDHHTNGAIVGPDGYVYFGQGTATNSGIVGPDNADFGWLFRRGSRPVWGTGDVLWKITPGQWYGWPDYSAGDSVMDRHYAPPGKPDVARLVARPPGAPPRPAAILGVHSSSNGFDFSRSPAFGHVGNALVAQLGDEAPTVGKVLHPVGFKVVRVDPATGIVEDFATNINSEGNGPASWIGSGGLERPIAARFDPSGESLYIVDFGVLLQDREGAMPQQKTGVLWRVRRVTP
jgi:glucose/arabinose dehydrogenase